MSRSAPASFSSGQEGHRTTTLRFEDNHRLQKVLGDHDRHLIRLEQGTGTRLVCRGNRVAISGETDAVNRAQAVLQALYQQAGKGVTLDGDQVDGVIRLTALPSHRRSPRRPTAEETAPPMDASSLDNLPHIQTKRGAIAPRSPGQSTYMKALASKELVFGLGPAGTGKTYLAVAQAVAMFQAGQVDRIILSRPAVEAGERLGFLPGDMREKIDPYLRPLYDALHDMMPGDQVSRRMASGEIEVAPLAFMRGRTLAHAYVILDEAQNTTPAQMKMFLTRMGAGTRMAITGDLSQIDLPRGVTSGLRDAVATLEGVKGIAVCPLTAADVVRHPLVARIVEAYDQKGADAAANPYHSYRTDDETPRYSPR
ncbi:MAG: PhoH family protein [Bombella sp.]|uniref:PhoH family protein n=1 Tax=Bombella apis TaxID=1785988 RepID=UPI0023F466A4|nr:PhoH family protein [Bombella apis]MCQ0041195.1 PhoH family protein [Bombella sp.]MCT6819047.1 PhoH family protein [Bombella apis]